MHNGNRCNGSMTTSIYYRSVHTIRQNCILIGYSRIPLFDFIAYLATRFLLKNDTFQNSCKNTYKCKIQLIVFHVILTSLRVIETSFLTYNEIRIFVGFKLKIFILYLFRFLLRIMPLLLLFDTLR